MSNLSQTDLKSLEASAAKAATYLDACDSGAEFVRLDPSYYKACGHLLLTIFAAENADSFPNLLQQSAAAREMAESLEIGRRIEVSRLGYYPHLAVILHRASV